MLRNKNNPITRKTPLNELFNLIFCEKPNELTAFIENYQKQESYLDQEKRLKLLLNSYYSGEREDIKYTTPLYQALRAKEAKEELVAILLKFGADPNQSVCQCDATNSLPIPPLATTVMTVDLSSARQLLLAQANPNAVIDFNQAIQSLGMKASRNTQDIKKTSLLGIAAITGSVEMTALLLENGAIPKHDLHHSVSPNKEVRKLPQTYALEFKKFKILAVYLKNNLLDFHMISGIVTHMNLSVPERMKQVEDIYRLPLYHTIAKVLSLDEIKQLEQYLAIDIIHNPTFVNYAAYINCVPVLKQLIAEKYNFKNCICAAGFLSGNPVLVSAVSGNQLGAITLLTSKDVHIDIDQSSETGIVSSYNALGTACDMAQPLSVQLLLKRGANPDYIHLGDDVSPLELACYAPQHNVEMVRLLLTHSHIDWTQPRHCTLRLLAYQHAHKTKNPELIKLLQPPSNLINSVFTARGACITLLILGIEQSIPTLVKECLDLKPNVNYKIPSGPIAGLSPLYCAAQQNDLNLVVALLQAGADPLLACGPGPRIGKSPLTLTFFMKYDAVMQVMVDALNDSNAIVNYNGINISLLLCAIIIRQYSAISYLLKKGTNPFFADVISDVYTTTAFETAMRQADIDSRPLVLLLRHLHVDQPIIDLIAKGTLPLYAACFYKNEKLMKLFLDSGAEFGATNQSGPFSGKSTVELLRENKMDIDFSLASPAVRKFEKEQLKRDFLHNYSIFPSEVEVNDHQSSYAPLTSRPHGHYCIDYSEIDIRELTHLQEETGKNYIKQIHSVYLMSYHLLRCTEAIIHYIDETKDESVFERTTVKTIRNIIMHLFDLLNKDELILLVGQVVPLLRAQIETIKYTPSMKHTTYTPNKELDRLIRQFPLYQHYRTMLADHVELTLSPNQLLEKILVKIDYIALLMLSQKVRCIEDFMLKSDVIIELKMVFVLIGQNYRLFKSKSDSAQDLALADFCKKFSLSAMTMLKIDFLATRCLTIRGNVGHRFNAKINPDQKYLLADNVPLNDVYRLADTCVEIFKMLQSREVELALSALSSVTKP